MNHLGIRSTRPTGQHKADRDREVDLSLAVLFCIYPGGRLTDYEIAQATGLSHSGVQNIEHRALHKLRMQLEYIQGRSHNPFNLEIIHPS